MQLVLFAELVEAGAKHPQSKTSVPSTVYRNFKHGLFEHSYKDRSQKLLQHHICMDGGSKASINRAIAVYMASF